ncbi:MAG: putative toxin-antitoxin system toxin component, PIN family [Candidatus Kapabacteria bacterium]|nr:putative toxin-antitoxin system toxin component, PIN family [Candidatus Kapabacteria bacterium]
MKLVIDTSVLIAAMLSNAVALKIIDLLCTDDSMSWSISKSIYNEYKLIINRDKFSFTMRQKQYWKDLVKSNTVMEVTDNDFHFSRDISDSKFIQLALSIHADYLLTYDKLLLGADYKIETSIVEPEVFISKYQIIEN